MDQIKKILAIDDEQVIIDAILKACSLENYSVDFTLSIKTAIQKIKKNYYSIIICDIMMQDGDGFQVLEEIQTQNIDSAIIMMTGYSTVENAVKSLYQGAIDFIPKPFTVDELLSSLSRASKYQEIIKKQEEFSRKGTEHKLLYVTCPAKYLRLGYTSWILQEKDGSALIGVCDILLKTIDSIKELELLDPEDEIVQGIGCLTIKTDNERIHRIHSPISGRIIKINQNLKINPNLIEKDPYFEGWVYRVIPKDIDYEIKHLIPCSSDRL